MRTYRGESMLPRELGVALGCSAPILLMWAGCFVFLILVNVMSRTWYVKHGQREIVLSLSWILNHQGMLGDCSAMPIFLNLGSGEGGNFQFRIQNQEHLRASLSVSSSQMPGFPSHGDKQSAEES